MTGWSPRRSSSGSPGAIFFIFFFPLARFSQLALSLGRTWTFDVPLSSLTRSHIFAFNDSSFKIYKKRNKKNSKPEELVHKEAASSANVPLLRRFSGGGTVLLGPGCVWATLVGGEEHLPGDVAGRGPRPLMEWTERVWAPVFGRIGDFKLREHGTSFFFFFFFFTIKNAGPPPVEISFTARSQKKRNKMNESKSHSQKIKQNKKLDYAFGDLKFGGNAQALSKRRWLHHTSLLWSFDPLRMQLLLKQPARAPEYREGREHGSFLTSLEAQNELAKRRRSGGDGGSVDGGGNDGGDGGGSSLFFESRRHFVDALAPAVASVGGFELVPTTLEEAEGMVEGVEHHRSTVVI